jgi:hypothetical protein
MACVYIPIISRLLNKKSTPIIEPPAPAPTIRSRGRAPWIIVILVIASSIVITLLGPPPLNESYWALRPRHSPALETVEEILDRIPHWNAAQIPLLITRGDAENQPATDPWRSFQTLEETGRSLIDSGNISSLFVPQSLWPERQRQVQNLALLAPLISNRAQFLAGIDAAGFGEQAGMFLSRVLAVWYQATTTASTGRMPCLPDDLAADWPVILKRFIAHDTTSEHTVLLGHVVPAETFHAADGTPHMACRPLEASGVYVTGWDCLQDATWPLMEHDFRWVFLPMSGVLLAMLALVYRNLRHIAATLAIMTLSWTFLIALMTLLARLRDLCPTLTWLPICEWNFMNLAAIPLLMGIGLDYSIHTTLSMNRHHHDLGRVWHCTGKAVILCGLSTAAGFGSLAFASNRGLSSLGVVCCLGILIITALSVIVLPRFLLLCASTQVNHPARRPRTDPLE